MALGGRVAGLSGASRWRAQVSFKSQVASRWRLEASSRESRSARFRPCLNVADQIVNVLDFQVFFEAGGRA